MRMPIPLGLVEGMELFERIPIGHERLLVCVKSQHFKKMCRAGRNLFFGFCAGTTEEEFIAHLAPRNYIRGCRVCKISFTDLMVEIFTASSPRR